MYKMEKPKVHENSWEKKLQKSSLKKRILHFEINEEIRSFFHEDINDEIITYIVSCIREGTTWWPEFITDTCSYSKEGNSHSFDINYHIEVHGDFAAKMGYWIPKMDLWITWYKWKLDTALQLLNTNLAKQQKSYQDEFKWWRDAMKKLSENLQKYAKWLKNLTQEDINNNWSKIILEECKIDWWLFWQWYSFFAHLLPFTKHEDWNKLQLAYKRRYDFLIFLYETYGADKVEKTTEEVKTEVHNHVQKISFEEFIKKPVKDIIDSLTYWGRYTLIQPLNVDEAIRLFDIIANKEEGDTKGNFARETILNDIVREVRGWNLDATNVNLQSIRLSMERCSQFPPLQAAYQRLSLLTKK